MRNKGLWWCVEHVMGTDMRPVQLPHRPASHRPITRREVDI